MNPEKYEPIPNMPEPKKVEAPKEILADQKSTDEDGDEKDTYELSGVEHELTSKYQPKFLAKGGEHIIYEIPEHPDVVVKVATEPLKKIIDWNVEHDQSMNALSPEIETRAREYIKQEIERYQQLKKYFGRDHVLGQRKFLIKLPITENILDAIYEGSPPATGNEVWGVAMVQRRAEELSDPERQTLVAGYSEKEAIQPEVYNKATDHLVLGKNPEQKISEEQLLEVQPNDHLKSLLERAENDESLKESLKDLVEKSITYTEKTGEVLDLAGSYNVTFSKKDGKWTYRLIDALYPGEKKMVEKTKIALLKLSLGTEIGEGEQNILMNAFNFVRTINGLAEQLGVQKRINIVPDGMTQEAMDFSKIIRYK